VCEHIPYLILPVRQLSREPFGIRRSAASEPSSKTPGPSRSDHCAEAPRASRRARRRARLIEPSAEAIHERAVGQDAGPVSIRMIRRSATSKPADKTLGSSHRTTHRSDTRASRRASHRARLKPPAEATRASRQAGCWARLEPSAEAIHERAVGQDAGPVSIRTIRQSATSERSGNTPGPSRSEPSAEAIHELSIEQAIAAEPRAIRRSSRSQRAPQISNRTP